MGDVCATEDLRVTGGNIQMRDINSTLQKHLGRLKECASALAGERDTLHDNSVEDNPSGVDLINFSNAQEVDRELDGLRWRKRKQEDVNIHRVRSKLAGAKQTVLNQDSKEDAEVQECLQEAGEMKQGAFKIGDAAEGLPVRDSLQFLKRRKRKIEASPIHKVGIDMNTVADRAPIDKLCVQFDAKVSSATDLGFQYALCSVGQCKDGEETGAVKHAREKGLTCACDEAVGTTIASSVLSRNELGSLMNPVLKNSGEIVSAAPKHFPQSCGFVDRVGTSLHKDSENREKVVEEMKQVPSMDQTENQKLRAALTALHSQLNVLLSIAEKGSKNCGHCQSIKGEIRKLSFNCGDISAGQVSAGKAVMAVQTSACGKAQEWSSPVGSCTSGKTAVSNDDCKRQMSSVLYAQDMESPLPPKDKESDLPLRNDLHEDIEEAECHICIDLASSQSEDLDTEQMKENFQDGSLESERNASIRSSIGTERECRFENLLLCLEKFKDYVPDGSTHGDVSSESRKGADNFHEGVEDEGECEDFADKNSKGGCWNAVSNRNSWGTYCGDVTNEAEDDGYIDLKCGCTSQKYGDTAGILRLYQSGKVEIQCQCSLGCIKGKPMSPANFERHGGRGASKKWKETIWIVLGDQKVQFSKVKGLDAFVRRYKESSQGRLRQPAPARLPYHRDEFVRCKKCSKRRRFRRKTKEECWLFHEASMNSEWECSNYPSDSVLSCQDDEEREARQANRGCARSRSCEGCIECVCLGCFTCRFEDCSCRLCVEYVVNNK